LSEERNLDWLSNLDSLSLFHKDLPGELASIFAIKRWHTVGLWVMSFLEGLKSCHEIMSPSNTGGDDSFSDASCDSAFDNSGYGIHRSYNLGLELRWDMELDLLE
jgi:hypothetical protein